MTIVSATWWTIEKPPHGSVEWLKARKYFPDSDVTLVSASNAAAVHGMHRFVTAAELAVELMDDAEPVPSAPNEAMERGNVLEPALLEWAKDKLPLPLYEPDMMYGFGRMVSTLDGLCGIYGRECYPVECKTTTSRWTGTLPAYWFWQGVQQAICTRSPKVFWVILDGNLRLHMYEQIVELEDKERHIAAVNAFLAATDMGMMPEHAAPTVEDLARMHTEVSPVPVDLPSEARELLAWYHTANSQLKIVKQELDAAKAELAALLGSAEVGMLDGEQVVTWKKSTRSSFDLARFESEHPHLVGEYQKKSSYRTMRVVGGNPND